MSVKIRGCAVKMKNKISYMKQRVPLLTKYMFYKYLYRIEKLAWVKKRKNRIEEYPTTIQLPITWKCNFDCVMCGMHHLVGNEDFTGEQLKGILSDKLFSKVQSIGVNGGEPFLRRDIVECVKIMLDTLPNLKSLNFISNGYYTDKILNGLEQIKKLCSKKGVSVNISLSVDGVSDMQDFMRGRKNAWINVNKTIDAILSERSKYCDFINIICTITKHNVFYLEEVEKWAKDRNLQVAYNIATVNARIDNYDRVKDFSIFGDVNARFMAQEFFYKKFFETKSKRYFGIFKFIKEQIRYAICDCAYNRWVTLTPDGSISYCATHSKILGSAYEESAYSLFNKNTDYLRELTDKECKTCSHYIYRLTTQGNIEYYKELLRIQKLWL